MKPSPVIASIYSPFGTVLEGRNWSAESYRYGFNGKEKEDDIASNDYDFGARIYDGRLGRWLSVDPLLKEFAMLSSYQFAANNPIFLLDPDGKVITPAGDNTGNSSAALSMYLLECYFITAFGDQMAAALMSSNFGGTLGAFSKATKDSQGNPVNPRQVFIDNFRTALSTIQDDYTKVLAIGVYEAIMSNETISFIAYADNQGQGTRSTSARSELLDLGDKQDYSAAEPMVKGTSSLQQLQNACDVLYDTDGPSPSRKMLDCALVAVSDGNYTNTGTVAQPRLAMGANSDFNSINRLAISVVEQIAATNRTLNAPHLQFDMPSSPVRVEGTVGFSNRQNSQNSEQNYFSQFATQLVQNLNQASQSIPLTRNQQRTTRRERRALTRRYNPRRTNFQTTDGG